MPNFDFSNPPIDPIQLSYDLVESMIIHGGLGLAANQIGLPYRVFAIAADPVLVCFNPKIVNASEQLDKIEEGCLTFPNLLLKIERPLVIRARYTRPNGETVTEQYGRLTARIFQHELDHLNGILFTDHVGPVALTMAKNKAKKFKNE